MPKIKRLSLGILVFISVSTTAQAQVTAVRFGTIVNPPKTVLQNGVVLIRDGIIESITMEESEIPSDALVIDLSEYTAIPGLIDVHTHMTYYWDRSPGTYPWVQLGERSPAITMYLAQENAYKTLTTGVTSVRDLMALDFTDTYMRDLIDMKAMKGPRMFVAGHGIQHSSIDIPAISDRPIFVDGPANVRRAVKNQVEGGADVIKLFGSTGSADDTSGQQTFTFGEMRAAVDEAHAAGLSIAIHCYRTPCAQSAARAGANSVEHAVDLDNETIAEMLKHGTFYVPTIDHNRHYIEEREAYGYDDLEAVEALESVIQENVESLRRAHSSGIRVAMGSDAVFTMFGENTRELKWFVEAGMTPAEALVAATINGAALLGMEDKLGRIAQAITQI